MSHYRSYDADWQRKKAVLVKRFFPKLIPIEEESGDTNNGEEVCASPPSPLPPLIIEKVPMINKHDEPQEYYDKLFKKIKSMYLKLFVENRNLSCIDSNSVNDNSDNNSYGSVESPDYRFRGSDSTDKGSFDEQSYEKESSDNETTQTVESEIMKIDDSVLSVEESHHSSIVDHETSESEEPNEPEDEQQPNNAAKSNQASNQNEHKSKEFKKIASEDEKKLKESNVEPMEEDVETTSDFSEGPHFREISTVAMVHFDGSQDADKSPILPTRFRSKMVHRNVAVDDRIEALTTPEEHGGPGYRSASTEAAIIHSDGSQDAGERESRVIRDSEKSPTLPTRQADTRNVADDDLMEVYVILEESAGPKTVPSIYTDTPEPDDKREGIIKMSTPRPDAPEEDHDFDESPILPTTFRREVVHRNAAVDDRIEVSTLPEENGGPKTVPSIYTDTPEPDDKREGIIKMSTPRPDAPEEDHDFDESPILPTTFRREVVHRNAAVDDRIEVSTLPEENGEPKNVPSFYTDAAEADEQEGIIEMGTPQADATEKNAEAMSTPRLDAPEEDNEEMSIPQQESFEEDVEGMGSPEPIELMRTPRPDLSHETIPITHRSHSESTSEHTAFPQELTALTSSTQDGAGNNMAEIRTSDEMNKILTAIFNESRNKDGTPTSGRKRKFLHKSVQTGSSISGKKRKLGDKSVQTGTDLSGSKINFVDNSAQTIQTGVTMTWNEIRSKLFMLSLADPMPKIFRLCSH